MSRDIQDSAGYYRLKAETRTDCVLRFDRGTLVLEGSPVLPPAIEAYLQFDPRIEAYRAPAHCYHQVISPLKSWLDSNRAPRYQRLTL